MKIVQLLCCATILAASLTASPLYTQHLSTDVPPGGLTQAHYPDVDVYISVAAEGDFLRYLYEIVYGPTIGSGQTGTGHTGNPGLSHFIINVSGENEFGMPVCGDGDGEDPGCFFDFNITGATSSQQLYGVYSGTGSNPGFPGSAYGVKIDSINPDSEEGVATILISFLSNRVPTVGTIYGKGGSAGYFYSTEAIVPDTEYYTPDDPGDPTPPVPEPSTFALLGAGLVSFGYFLRRR